MFVEEYSARQRRFTPVKGNTSQATQIIRRVLGEPPLEVELDDESSARGDYWVKISKKQVGGRLDAVGILNASISGVGRISAQVTEAA